MTITANRLTAISGLSAAAAGAIFVGVQINHPPADVAHLVTTEMTIRMTAKILMCVLALLGFTGMFLRHRGRFGRLGRAGYGLLSVGYLAMLVQECFVGYYLPTVAQSNPGYVQHVLNAAMGHGASGGIGHLRELFLVAGIGYSLGGLLFGIALFRAGVLARWACLLLAYGTTSALALSMLPESFSRPFAVPTGVALIGLGVSLWRDQRQHPALTTYAVRIHGHLDDHWSARLGEPDMTREDDGTTIISASIADQAQLHGILAGLRDIGAVITEIRTTPARGERRRRPRSATNAG